MFRSIRVNRGFRLEQVGTVPFCNLVLELGLFLEAAPDKFGTFRNWRGGPLSVVVYAERPFEAGNCWEKVALVSASLPPYPRGDYERKRFPPFDKMSEAQLAGYSRYWTGASCSIKTELALDTALWPGKYRLVAVIARSFQEDADHRVSCDMRKRVVNGYRSGIVDVPLGLFENGRFESLSAQAGLLVPVGQAAKKRQSQAYWVPEILEPDLPSFKRHYLRLGNTSLARARYTGQRWNRGSESEVIRYSVRLGKGNSSRTWGCRMDFGRHPLICVDINRTFPLQGQAPTGLDFSIGKQLRTSVRSLISLADETRVAESPFAPAYTKGLIGGAGGGRAKHMKAAEASIERSRNTILDGKRALESDWGPRQVAIALKVAAMTPGRIAIMRDPNNFWMKSYAALFLYEYCVLSQVNGLADYSEQLLLCLDLAAHSALQLRTIERILGDKQDTPHNVAAELAGITYFNKDVLTNLNTVFQNLGLYDLFEQKFSNLDEVIKQS